MVDSKEDTYQRNPGSFNLTKRERFYYSLTNLPNTLLSGIFGLTYVNFFWDDLGLIQLFFSLGQIIYAIINSLNDFYLGRLSDNTNFNRWGSRRLIYIRWGGILWAIVFFMMWFPWTLTNQIAIFIHFVLSICAFDMLLTLVWLAWLALMPEITENLEERNKIAFLNQVFFALGAFPVLLAFLIYDAGLIYFQIFAGVCAIICGLCYFLISTKLRERPELYLDQQIFPLAKALKEVLKSKSFITMTLFRCFNHLNLSLTLSFIFAYFYIFNVSSLIISLLFYFNTTFIALIGYGIYKKLSQKYDMRTLIIRGRIIHIILNVSAFMILLIPGLELLIWPFLILGTICNGYILFDYPVLILVTDNDEVQHGTRREGLIIGTNAFFIKIAESLGPIIGTSILLLFGFVRNAPFQTELAIFGIKFLFFIVQSILNLLGLISIKFFPLYKENLEEMHQKLIKIHKKKVNEFKK
ncbi:MAG: MFS transporter [Promethearchaeota archaeon]